ncbi:hypothetical protein N658DRAFT_165188 [Parathielavia hyrcaniae]|uniref:Uncharacterized protein n=1 Tax=Parathielavia hyrcaniae TaxID=113614 RepID=A0AAN6PZF1_9PEZI|nr:hypothetical protein N658DRAFT_165188 [Parathielavia hyrcaniae]
MDRASEAVLIPCSPLLGSRPIQNQLALVGCVADSLVVVLTRVLCIRSEEMQSARHSNAMLRVHQGKSAPDWPQAHAQPCRQKGMIPNVESLSRPSRTIDMLARLTAKTIHAPRWPYLNPSGSRRV